jgi:hypothetical protein
MREGATCANGLLASRNSRQQIDAVHHLLPRHDVDQHRGAAAVLGDEQRLARRRTRAITLVVWRFSSMSGATSGKCMASPK